MNKKILSVGVSFAALTAIVLIPSVSMAYRGDFSVKSPNYTQERHEAMQKAFDSVNFTEWKNLMEGKGRVTQVVNKDNFAKFVEAHRLMVEGKTDDAKKIRQDLGLGLNNGAGKGQGLRMNSSR